MIKDRKSSRYNDVLRPRKAFVRAGILEPAASSPHEGSNLSIGELGAVHEFGSSDGRVPQRSFIRGWFDESQAAITALFLSQFRLAAAGKIFYEQAVERCALTCAAAIQRRIVAGIDPPLKQATIDRKGSSTPLIDTGVLKSAITAEGTLE